MGSASRGCRRHEATTVKPATCPGGRRPHPPRSARMLPAERNTTLSTKTPRSAKRTAHSPRNTRGLTPTLPDTANCTQT